MAKTDNLIHYLSDVADAIREKEGTTDPINAQDFSEKIRSMSIGSDPGFLDYYYLRSGDILVGGQTLSVTELVAVCMDFSRTNVLAAPSIGFVKIESSEGSEIHPIWTLLMGSGVGVESCTAVAIPKYFFVDLEKFTADGTISSSFPNRTSLNDILSLVFGASSNMEEAAKDLFITSEEF